MTMRAGIGGTVSTALALALSGCGGGGAVALPEDAVERAATCGVVAAARARAATGDIKTPLSFAQQGMILRPALLHATGGGRYVAEAAAAVVDRMPAMGADLNPKRVDALAPQCAQAFPAAAGPVTLPADPLVAALGCEGLGGFMARGLEAQADDYGSELVRLAALDRVLDDRVAPLLRARGLRDTAAAEAEGAKAFATIVRAGAPAAILDACFARYTPG